MTLSQSLRRTVGPYSLLATLLVPSVIGCTSKTPSEQEANTLGASITFTPTQSLESSAAADSMAIARARTRTDFVPDSSVANLSEAISDSYYSVRIRVFPDGNMLRDFVHCLYDKNDLESVGFSSTLTDRENFRIFSSNSTLYIGTKISPSMDALCGTIRVRALDSAPVSPDVPLFKIG